jgi:hypothetical protein
VYTQLKIRTYLLECQAVLKKFPPAVILRQWIFWIFLRDKSHEEKLGLTGQKKQKKIRIRGKSVCSRL